jgi:hypothetical protein
LNPSGLGPLSLGKSLRDLKISSSEKGWGREERATQKG